MDKFQEVQKPAKTKSQKKKENLNTPVASKEIKSVIKYLPTKENSELDHFTGEFYWILKELLSTLLKLFKNIEEVGTLLNSFNEACWHQSQTKTPQEKKSTHQYPYNYWREHS